MNTLIAIYIAWIVAQTGLVAPDQPPSHFIARVDMAALGGVPENNPLEFQALYNHEEGSIYLPHGWQPDDLKRKSVLLHELVHHVQRANNVEAPCVAAYERQAYELQMKWLREQGVDDPYHLVGTNELTIYLVSVCRDGS